MTQSDAHLRLATYGTLAPGRVNAGQLSKLNGDWTTGIVRGRLVDAGWGAQMGYPGLILEDGGEVIDVHLFSSADLPAYWPQLDAFEGAGYRRVETRVETAQGPLAAFIYEIAD